MGKAIKWTWGKYNGLFKDESLKSFTEIWKYETQKDESWKAMEERALELINAGYYPEATEYVEV